MTNRPISLWPRWFSFVFSIMLLTPLLFNLASADSFRIFPLDSKPYGLTYSDWSTKFWQWLLKIPSTPPYHPADDPSGAACDKSQDGPVWFLAGTSGSKQVRSCAIPYGKAILVSPIEAVCSFAEYPTLRTEAELKACAKADQDKVTSLELIIDNVPLSNISKYRVASQIFNFTLPENNIFGVNPQETQGVSDGYWIILEPLPKGDHKIVSKGAIVDPTEQLNFVSDVTWQITVR